MYFCPTHIALLGENFKDSMKKEPQMKRKEKATDSINGLIWEICHNQGPHGHKVKECEAAAGYKCLVGKTSHIGITAK